MTIVATHESAGQEVYLYDLAVRLSGFELATSSTVSTCFTKRKV